MRRTRTVAALLLVPVLLMVGTHLARPAWYIRMVEPLEYPNYIVTHAENYDLPPELVAAVIAQESGFDEHARSPAGAVGLMQLTPETARGIAKRTGGREFQTGDLLDPEINIRYGSWYLQHLHEKYDRVPEFGEERHDLALAAYNAGQGHVDEWLRDDEDGFLQVHEIPFPETREYVRKVQRRQEWYRRGYARELGIDGS